MKQLYAQHLEIVSRHFEKSLAQSDLDYLLIPSGAPVRMFMDDMDYPFKVNAYFNYLVPLTNVPHCWVVVQPGKKLTLHFYQPEDFWHKVEALGDSFWESYFDIVTHTQSKPGFSLPPGRGAILGNPEPYPEFSELEANPEELVSAINWYRAYKTDYEVACLKAANELALPAHKAAEMAFREGLSEAEINASYLNALRVTSDKTPYRNIVCLNENASILHYTVYNTEREKNSRSFLIDAGASFRGYGSDITRTYAKEPGHFSDLISAMDAIQQKLVTELSQVNTYSELHFRAHQHIAELLVETGLVKSSAQSIVEKNISSTFFPHGLGHLLGLWVHDPGGHQASVSGGINSPDPRYPFLRCTRQIETNQVFTIEPGLYFIDSLLAELKASSDGKLVDWATVDAYKPFGGIRIEDNVLVTATGVQNLTR